MQPTILAIFAHPDDESFCCGGTLALLAKVARVEVLCCTRGEASSAKPTNGISLAQMRTAELHAACTILGTQAPHFLEYHDSGFHTPSQFGKRLADADIFAVAKEVRTLIATLEPQVLISFDPRGYYGHPDHIAVHRIVQAAFFSSAMLENPPHSLLYTMPSSALLERFRQAGFGELATDEYALPDPYLRVDCSTVREQKRKAILVHQSQSGTGSGIDKLLPELHNQDSSPVFDEELFALGASRGQHTDLARLMTCR